MSAMTLPANLDQLSADELRELVRRQAEVITRNDRELNWRQVKIDKLTHEVAYYKRHYFGVKAERLPVEQGQLFEETLAADMAAITEELEQVSEPKPKGQAKRTPLPPELPRTEIHHEPESTKAHGISQRLANLDAAAGNDVPNKSAMCWISSREGSSFGAAESHC